MSNRPIPPFRTLAPIFLLLATLASPAIADQVLLRDGKTLTGEITAEDEQTLTLRMSHSTSTIALSRRISKSQVKQVIRPKHEGPAYVSLPITGEIGRDITATSLRAGLAEAALANPRYLVLEIDSPGGNIAELEAMLELLSAAQRDREVVAYVRDAYSAAAILAMSCRQIYLAPQGTIGAAVPFTVTTNGPKALDAKIRSAIEARQRARIASAGHDPLLLHGMMDLDCQIYLTESETGPALSAEGPDKILKSKGTILTLTAAEAAECGLAAIATDLADLGRQLSGGPWHEPTRQPWNAVIATASRERTARGEAHPDTRTPAARAAAVSRVKSEFDAINRELETLRDKAAARTKAITARNDRTRAELDRIADEYRTAMARAKTHADAARAKDIRDAAIASVKRSADAEINRILDQGSADAQEINKLRARQRDLLATLPTD